jgi:outer membrane receptor protein involved in Fe transport
MRGLAAVSRASALAWFMTSIPAHALDDESPVEGTDPADEPIEEIVVIGVRRHLVPSFRVTVLSRRDIERGGATSLADTLQSLPMNAGSALNTNVNVSGEPLYGDWAGDGSVRVALRGHDTLVLLNGRRFLNSGAGADVAVDLNSLPISFVESVEVLPSGAGAVYGSGAVGGVINVVTRRDLAGITTAVSQTLTGHGDGGVTMGRVAAGFELLGGTWLVGLEKVSQEGVTLDRRDYSAVPQVIVDEDGTRAAFPNRATPDGRFEVPAGNSLGLQPGLYTRVEGSTGRSAADYRTIDRARDYFNVAPYNYSQTPNERGSAWLIGSLPLGEHGAFFVEGLADRRQSARQVAPAGYFGVPAPTLADGSEVFPATGYYNPFGVDLVHDGPPVVSRRLVELGNRGYSDDVDLWRLLAGLEGRAGDWAWTLSVADAASEATTRETGAFLPSRMVRAVGPSGPDESGRIVCGTPDPATGLVPAQAVIPGCVPVDLFGGRGTITPAQLGWLSPGTLEHTGSNEALTADLVLAGPLGRLAGGELSWVLGAEYRRERGSNVVDPRVAEETGESVLTGSEYTSRDLFAELRAPLLRERRWAQELELHLALRWSDSSAFDGHLSQQVGLHWKPVPEWTLRASYADVYNEPDLWALHDPRVSFRGFEFDPCGNKPTPAEQANCAANGVPGGAYTQYEEEFEILAGGSPGLEPESGFSIGAGLEYAPRWAPGLTLSADYYRLEIGHLIGQLDLGTVLGECATRGVPEACDDIERHPDGRIRRVATYTENLGGMFETRGVDFAVGWEMGTPLGQLNATLRATYLERWDEQPFRAGSAFEHAGKFDAGAMPHWRGFGTVDLGAGPWLVSYSAEYMGSYTQTVFRPPIETVFFDDYTRRVESVLYHDIEGRYEFGNSVTLRAAITNFTDEDPPYVNLVSAANTDPGTYRLLGRSFFLELRYDFAAKR